MPALSISERLRARGDLAAFLDGIEREIADFGLVLEPSDNRHRLAYLHGGVPSFPGWFPREMQGSAPGFWLDFRDRFGRIRRLANGRWHRRQGQRMRSEPAFPRLKASR